MQRAFDSTVYEVGVKWSRPKLYANALDTDADELYDAFFYKIIGKYNGSYHLLYIGKTYDQFVTDRLQNKDHQKKRAAIQKKYSRHELLVSFGFVSSEEKRNRRLIDEVESLLIYTHSDHTKLQNKNKIWSHKITRDYKIINSGFRKDEMVKEIALGLFFKW